MRRIDEALFTGNSIDPVSSALKLAIGGRSGGTPTTVSANGFVNIEDAVKGKLTSLKVKGVIEQDGVPSPSVPKALVCNNGPLKARRPSGLPLGYQKLEYLESSGGACIDSGVRPDFTKNFTIETEIAIPDTAKRRVIIGNYGSGARGVANLEITVDEYIRTYFADANNTMVLDRTITRSLPINTKIKVSSQYLAASPNSNTTCKITIDGVTTSNTHVVRDVYSAGVSNKTFLLFLDHREGTSQIANPLKIYSTLILVENTPVRHFIPARRISDGVLGMYDLVTDAFFTNVGAGAFVTGQIEDHIEIYADGNPETVQITGKNLFNMATDTGGFALDANGELVESSGYEVSDFTPIRPSTQFRFSADFVEASGNITVAYYDYKKTFLSRTTMAVSSLHRIVNVYKAGAKYVRISFPNSATNIQLEYGTQATEYTAFTLGGTGTVKNLFGVTVYDGEHDVVTGEVTQRARVVVLDGTENWVYGSPISNSFTVENFFPTTPNPTSNCRCTHFPSSTASNNAFYAYSNGLLRVRYDDANGDVSTFKSWLASQLATNPVMLVYPVEAYTESVAPQGMKTVRGINNTAVMSEYRSTTDFTQTYARR